MKILFVTASVMEENLEGARTAECQRIRSIWKKAMGLADRGHEVWVLSSAIGNTQGNPCNGMLLHEVRAGFATRAEANANESPSWPAVVAAEIIRLHQVYGLDIVDIPLELSEIHLHLRELSEAVWMPAFVQQLESPSKSSSIHPWPTAIYPFPANLHFSGGSPMEDHIAILRLESFFHGVLNLHFASHRPAA